MDIKKLKEGSKAVGMMLKITDNPAILHVAANAGLDFLMLDMEHGSYTYKDLENLAINTLSLDTKLMVRVPELSKGYVSRALDLGAKGVMVPMIRSADQAKQLVDFAKYQKTGNRGISLTGAHTGYIKPEDMEVFMREQNEGTLCIAQIETQDAVDDIDGIAAVDGIDVLFIGPNDLASSLGCPGRFDSDIMQTAVERIASAAKKHKKCFGMHAGIEMIRKWMPFGLDFIMVSTDADILFAGMKEIAKAIKTDQ